MAPKPTLIWGTTSGFERAQANNVTTTAFINRLLKRAQRRILGKTVQVIPHITDEIKTASKHWAAPCNTSLWSPKLEVQWAILNHFIHWGRSSASLGKWGNFDYARGASYPAALHGPPQASLKQNPTFGKTLLRIRRSARRAGMPLEHSIRKTLNAK